MVEYALRGPEFLTVGGGRGTLSVLQIISAINFLGTHRAWPATPLFVLSRVVAIWDLSVLRRI